MNKLLLAIAIITASGAVCAEGLLTKPLSLDRSIVTINNNEGVLSSHGGFVTHLPNQGITFMLPDSELGRGSVLEFKFKADNYFSNGNGHIAAGLRGSIGSSLNGNGIILGNVSLYSPHSGECTPTVLPDDITFETMWTGGNCVYGERPNQDSLKNDVLYSVRVVVDDKYNKIKFDIVSEDGSYERSDVVVSSNYAKAEAGQSFFIGTIPDQGSVWTIQLGDINYYNFN